MPRPARLDGGARKVRVNRCSNGGWHRELVGKIVNCEFIDSDGCWAREGGVYNCINKIPHEDVTVMPLEN